MITPLVKKVKDYIIEKKWLKPKQKYRDNRSSREGCWSDEEMENIKSYEETLDRFRRENPKGLRLYDKTTSYEKPNMIRKIDG